MDKLLGFDDKRDLKTDIEKIEEDPDADADDLHGERSVPPRNEPS